MHVSIENLRAKQHLIQNMEKNLQNHAMELEEKSLEQQQMQVLIEQVKHQQSSLEVANQEREQRLEGCLQENRFLKERMQQYETHFASISSKEEEITQLLESNNKQIIKQDDINQGLQHKIEGLQLECERAQQAARDLQQKLHAAESRLQL